MTLSIRSDAFADGAEIPAVHTCEGANTSPPLAFGGVPAAARALALIVDDPDAPDPKAPRMTFVHWLLYDLPAAATGLAAGAPPPAGTREGTNNWKRTGWGGPCPPVGRHRYFFKLYALDAPLGDLGAPSKAKLEAAMAGHVLAEARLMGTYEKRRP